MFTLGQLLACVLLPAVLVLVLTPMGRDQRPGWWSAGLASLLLAAAAATGHLGAALALGDALAPPVRGWHWFIAGGFLIAAAAVVPGVWLRLAACFLASGGAVALALQPLAGLPLGVRSGWALGVAVAVVFAGWLGERAVVAEGPRRGHALLLLFAAGGAATIGLSGSKDLALLAGTVASALGGSALWSLRGGSVVGLAAPVAALALGHVALGAGYADLPWESAVALGLALPVAGLTTRVVGWPGTILRFAVVLVALGSALGLAQRACGDTGGYPAG